MTKTRRKPHGTNSEYLRARLKTQHPEISKALDAGEYKSVHRAAIEAGIVKVPTALDQVKKLLPRLSGEDREELRRLLG